MARLILLKDEVKMTTASFGVRLKIETSHKILKLARVLGKSRNHLINQAIVEFIDRNQNQKPPKAA